LVVITHMHLDHAGNINFFPDIYFHPADTVLMSRVKPYPGKAHYVKDGDVFDLGGKLIEVRHMPAHTPGSIVLVDKQDGDCFTGDAFGSGQVWLQLCPYSNMETYINSCTKMLQLMNDGIERIYCGHYPYSNGALSKEYIVKMKELATDLNNGSAKDCQPYNIKVSISCPNPMLYSKDNIGIVYDPEHIKF
jgi:hydroxyacylglutathione hydrolase